MVLVLLICDNNHQHDLPHLRLGRLVKRLHLRVQLDKLDPCGKLLNGKRYSNSCLPHALL